MSRLRPAWVFFAIFFVVLPAAFPVFVGDAAAQTQRQRREQQQREQQEREQREQQQREQQQREQQQREQQQRQQQAPAPPAPPTTAPAAAPARPVEQPPVPVRVVPTPKTDEELAAEREQRERWSVLDSRLQMLAILLAALGLFQIVVFSVQALFVWFALRAMRRSALLTERNMTMAQRAFVHVSSLAWSPAGAGVKITPTWENNGTTPTRSLRISTAWKAWHGELPADFAYSYTRPPDRLFLGPKGQSDTGFVVIPMRDLQAAIEERVALYFWGRATYEDVFEGTEPHFVEFCYRLDVKGTTPNAVTLAFSHFGPYNRTEEDSQRPAVLDGR